MEGEDRVSSSSMLEEVALVEGTSINALQGTQETMLDESGQGLQAVSSSQDEMVMLKRGIGVIIGDMDVLASSSSQGSNMMASSSSQVVGMLEDEGLADSSSSPAMDPQFAASLREKLENLSGPTACRSRDSENSDYENGGI